MGVDCIALNEIFQCILERYYKLAQIFAYSNATTRIAMCVTDRQTYRQTDLCISKAEDDGDKHSL